MEARIICGNQMPGKIIYEPYFVVVAGIFRRKIPERINFQTYVVAHRHTANMLGQIQSIVEMLNILQGFCCADGKIDSV